MDGIKTFPLFRINEAMATRQASGKALDALKKNITVDDRRFC
jgi:hypothetical protein